MICENCKKESKVIHRVINKNAPDQLVFTRKKPYPPEEIGHKKRKYNFFGYLKSKFEAKEVPDIEYLCHRCFYKRVTENSVKMPEK